MPNITEYTSPVEGIRADDRGTNAYQQEGRRLGGFYHQMGQDIGNTTAQVGQLVEKHQSFQEISHGIAVGATVQADLHKSLDDTLRNADPNDPNVVNDWMSNTMQPKLQQLQDAPQTQAGKEWALNYTKSLGQTLTEKARGEQSALAGQAAIQNYNHALNQTQATVQSDPTGVDGQIGMMRMNIKALTEHMDPEAAAQLQTHFETTGAKAIVQTAVRSQMDANPEAGLAALSKGGGAIDQYLDDSDKEGLTRYAEAAQRMKTEQTKAAALDAKTQREGEAKKVYSSIIASSVQPDGSIQFGPQAFSAYQSLAKNYGDVVPSEVASLGNAMQEANRRAINHEDVQSNPNIANSLYSAAADGSLTTQSVDASIKGLSTYDYSHLHEAAKDAEENGKKGDPLLKPALDVAKAYFGTALGGATSYNATQALYNFNIRANEVISTARKSGMTDAEISAKYLNPNSADPNAYLMGNLQQYAKVSGTGQGRAVQNPKVTTEDMQAFTMRPGADPATVASDQKKAYDALSPNLRSFLDSRKGK